MGTLSESEAERLDERSITDGEFAEILNAAEKDLIDAYVNGELTGSTLETFKSSYLSSPVRRDKVLFAEAFRDVGKNIPVVRPRWAEETEATKTDGSPLQNWFSIFDIWTSRRVLQWGIAAVVVFVLAAGGWLIVRNRRLQRQATEAKANRDAQDQRNKVLNAQLEQQPSKSPETEIKTANPESASEGPPADPTKQEAQRDNPVNQNNRLPKPVVATFFLMPQLRGAGQVKAISIPPKADRLAMHLQLEGDDYSAYRVDLVSQSNQQSVWKSSSLRSHAVASGKSLTVSLAAAILKPQTYVLKVYGVTKGAPDEIVSDYPFVVVK